MVNRIHWALCVWHRVVCRAEQTPSLSIKSWAHRTLRLSWSSWNINHAESHRGAMTITNEHPYASATLCVRHKHHTVSGRAEQTPTIKYWWALSHGMLRYLCYSSTPIPHNPAQWPWKVQYSDLKKRWSLCVRHRHRTACSRAEQAAEQAARQSKIGERCHSMLRY